MRRLLILLLLLFPLLPAYAQLDNDSLQHRFPPVSLPVPAGGEMHPGNKTRASDVTLAGEKSLSLDLFTFGYFRNYEYFNDFADGLTYYGLQFRPQLIFRPNPHLALYGGTFLSKDFGDPGFRHVKPILGIRYEKKGVAFTTGTIEPHISHGYIEPLLDYDMAITDPVEYGTQLKFDRKRHETDLWISWKNMIYKPSGEQEEILGGASTRLHLLKKEGHLLSLPLQVLGWHRGGQIDTTSLEAVSHLNLAAGIEYAWEREGDVKKLFTKNYVVTSGSTSEQAPYERGGALYLNAGVETRWLDAMLSYWSGHRFTAPAGAPVFQSVSSHIDHPGLLQEDRSLLFLRLKKDFTLADELFVSARLEPFWDFDGEYADYSMSLYVVYQGFFQLLRPESRR